MKSSIVLLKMHTTFGPSCWSSIKDEHSLGVELWFVMRLLPVLAAVCPSICPNLCADLILIRKDEIIELHLVHYLFCPSQPILPFHLWSFGNTCSPWTPPILSPALKWWEWRIISFLSCYLLQIHNCSFVVFLHLIINKFIDLRVDFPSWSRARPMSNSACFLKPLQVL